ncbi:hypothetical protein KSP40_PGU011783 [Platanthera guangdongensis]|uniref:Sugar phosphate transporter domain-containing protein n=1 Tax=Platanthera guangdongensis TaxID=2320717 RepID=A0ABR2LD05_9ASPA
MLSFCCCGLQSECFKLRDPDSAFAISNFQNHSSTATDFSIKAPISLVGIPKATAAPHLPPEPIPPPKNFDSALNYATPMPPFPPSEEDSKSEKRRKTANLAAVFGLWYFQNVIFNIYNKKALNLFPYPWLLASFQLLVGSLWMAALWASKLQPFPRVNPRPVKPCSVSRRRPHRRLHLLLQGGRLFHARHQVVGARLLRRLLCPPRPILPHPRLALCSPHRRRLQPRRRHRALLQRRWAIRRAHQQCRIRPAQHLFETEPLRIQTHRRAQSLRLDLHCLPHLPLPRRRAYRGAPLGAGIPDGDRRGGLAGVIIRLGPPLRRVLPSKQPIFVPGIGRDQPADFLGWQHDEEGGVIIASVMSFRNPVRPLNALGSAMAIFGTFLYSQATAAGRSKTKPPLQNRAFFAFFSRDNFSRLLIAERRVLLPRHFPPFSLRRSAKE